MKIVSYLTITTVVIFAATASSYSQSRAAAKTACHILPASEVSRIVGKAVTERLMVTPAVPSGVCVYSAGRPILQFSLIATETTELAARMSKMQTREKDTIRQKGNVVLQLMPMNVDRRKFDALLDAAAKNL